MKKVFVYYNVRKKMFSIRDVKTRKVIAHSVAVILHQAEFKVSEAGRQRVLKTKRKNVHAGVQGYLGASGALALQADTTKWSKVTYNPYKGPDFVSGKKDTVVRTARTAILKDRAAYV